MSTKSTPTPRRRRRRATAATALRRVTPTEALLLVALLALAIGGRGSITASGDVTNTTIFSLATAP